jgi:polysaccharide chain length determinant protein (PEP-CTERM system associated)
MINPQRSFNIHYYIDIFLRRFWYILIPMVVVFAGASIYALTAPKVYRATTLVLVIPQKIPEAIIKPTVTSSIEDRLQSIGQEVLSRTRLEQIIAELKLYPKEIKSLSKEEVVELMRKNIKIEIKGVGEGSRSSSRTEGYFTISYFGEDPQVVTMVTNKLASLFIEENLKFREQQAQGTVEFISTELKAAKEKLDEQDKEITAFKKQNLNELPEQRDANLKVLEQLQLQHQRISESLGKAEDRKLVLQSQLSSSKVLGMPAQNSDTSMEETPIPSSQSSPAGDLNEKHLILLKAQLEELLAKYTPKHPDVVVTKKKIAELEKNIQESEKPVIPQEKTRAVRKVDPLRAQANLIQEERKSQLLATDLEIKKLKNEDVKLKTMMSEYQARIEKTPMRELTLNALSRDYKNTYETYQSLLQKNVISQQAENLERRQKGEQFKILDPARIPEKPFKPDIPKTLLVGLLLGVGAGIGMAFLREQMDRSFRDAEDLTTTLGIKVLANIPRVENKAA